MTPSRRTHLVVAGLFVALSALACWPVLVDPAHLTFRSVDNDNFANFWNLWWVQHALTEGKSLLETDLLYYPLGTSLTHTEFGPLYGLLAFPLGKAGGYWLVFAHNLFLVLSFAATGYAMFLFARWMTGSVSGSFLAAAAVAFSAYRVHHLQHLNLLSTYWIPLAVYVAARLCLRPPLAPAATDPEAGGPGSSGRPAAARSLLGLAACGLGISLTSYTYLAFTAFLLSTWFGAQLILDRRRFLAGARWRLPAAAAALGLGAVPMLWGWIEAALRGDSMVAPADEVVKWSPDVLGFFVPARSWVLGPVVAPLQNALHGSGGLECHLGWAFLALAVYAGVRAGRPALPLALAGVVIWLVSWGPGIWAGGHRVEPGFSPYALVKNVAPFFSSSRTPGRLVVPVLIVMAPLAAAGFQRLRAHRRGRLLAALAVGLFLVETIGKPAPTERVRIDSLYARLAADPRPGGVVDISVEPRRVNEFMLYQTVHRRPIFGGPLSRPTPGIVRQLKQLDLNRRLFDSREVGAVILDFRNLGFVYLIWHRDRFDDERWRTLVATYGRHAPAVDRQEERIVFWIGGSPAGGPHESP